MRDIDRHLSKVAGRRPPGGAERMLAALVSPWGATAHGLVAAVALRRAGRPGIPAALAPALTILAGKAMKNIVGRARPGISRFERNGRRSFPSTHVAGPAALLSCLFCVSPRSAGWRVSLALGTAITVLVACERVAARKHWPSDVVAGVALGAAVGALVGLVGPRALAACGAVRAAPEGRAR
jgi:membrane-associated phospholipid phosphatase